MRMNKTKIFIIFIIIGIVLGFVVGPILGVALSKAPKDKGVQVISEESDTNFAERYAQSFRLKRGQTCYVRFSNYYPNITVDLIILTKSDYDNYYEINGTLPTTGENFILSDGDLGDSSPTIHTLTSYDISPSGGTYGSDVLIDFRGNGMSSIPGDYYVVVEGENSYAGNDEVRFYISISIDGPGERIQNIMMIIGIVIIAVAVLIWIYFMLKPKEGER